MGMVFLAKGTCTLGVTKKDKDGNVESSTQAQFTFDDAGGSIAVGEMDPDTEKIDAETVSIFGDWDAAGYLAEVLKLWSGQIFRNGIPSPSSIWPSFVKLWLCRR